MIDFSIYIAGLVVVVTGSFAAVAFIAWFFLDYTWEKIHGFRKAIDVHTAIVFHRQYSGQLQNGKLVCNKCKEQTND